MNYTPEEARELVAVALESGDYKQGIGKLENHVTMEYCCLGVATRIFMEHEEHDIVTDYKVTRYLGSKTEFISPGSGEAWTGTLLKVVQDWLGFRTGSGNWLTGSLVEVNDRGTPFTEIAKLFRNPPEGLLA